ncbi:MAG: hypothetical protein ABL963_06520 [Longimicrobiales bacterium]
MKRVTASDARKHWFRLLDEVAGGETVTILRGGRTIVIQRAAATREATETPDYHSFIRAASLEAADEWGWRWPGADGELEFEHRRKP